MPASRSANVEPSYTKRAFDFLIGHDDFISSRGIADATGLTIRQLRQTLHWLRCCKAIDSVDSGGTLYWFATPERDTRRYRIDEHLKEDEPRNPRGAGRRKATISQARVPEKALDRNPNDAWSEP